MRLVCITGIDGSGKSTVVRSLADRWRATGLAVTTSGIWDSIGDPHFAGRALFTDRSQADDYLALLDPVGRMHFMSHALHTSLERARASEPDVVLLNAYWFKYVATEVAHGGDPSALRAVTRSFPTPDATIQLVIPVEESARRKTSFSRYETGFGPTRDASAFESFQKPAADVMDDLAAELDWTTVAATRPQEDVVNQVVLHLTEAGVETGTAGA